MIGSRLTTLFAAAAIAIAGSALGAPAPGVSLSFSPPPEMPTQSSPYSAELAQLPDDAALSLTGLFNQFAELSSADEAIFYAIRDRNLALVQTLIATSGDLDFRTAISTAAEVGDLRIFRYLLDSGASLTGPALIRASETGNIGIVQEYVDRGFDITWGNNVALIRACSLDRASVVRLLLANGADVHANSNLPLRIALQFGHENTIRALIEGGGDLDGARRGNQNLLRDLIPR